MIIIETQRLQLRDWRTEDILPFVEMNSNPRVMKYFLETIGQKRIFRFLQPNTGRIFNIWLWVYAVQKKRWSLYRIYRFHNISFDVDFAPELR